MHQPSTLIYWDAARTQILVNRAATCPCPEGLDQINDTNDFLESSICTLHWGTTFIFCLHKKALTRFKSLSNRARLDGRTYTFAHLIWRAINAACKHGAIASILRVFPRYYLRDAIMLSNPSMVPRWATGITSLGVVIIIVNFAWDAGMNTVKMRVMRERINQDSERRYWCVNVRILFADLPFTKMD